MTVFVPGYKNDVFVSYATVDNQVDGWVKKFVENLTAFLITHLGCGDNLTVWWDDSDIDRIAQLDAQIPDEVMQSALLCVILTPSYVNSKWCKREKQWFMETLADQSENHRQIVIIDQGILSIEERPDELKNVLGFEFYTVSGKNKTKTRIKPSVQKFKDKIELLSKSIGDRLKELKKEREQNPQFQAAGISQQSAVKIDPFDLLKRNTRRQIETLILNLSDEEATNISAGLRSVSSRLEQLELILSKKNSNKKLQELLVECFLEHNDTIPVVPVGNLVNLYLDRTFNSDEQLSDLLAKIINLMIPLEFSKNSIQKAWECLKVNNSVVVEGAVGTRKGAEVIMAAHDGQPTAFSIDPASSNAEMFSPNIALETPPLSEASEKTAVLLMLKDLAAACSDISSVEIKQLDPQEQIQYYAGAVRGLVEACFDSKRTPYCVQNLPSQADREEVLNTINAVSDLVKTDYGTIVFVELCYDGRAFDISAETKLLTLLNRINPEKK